jgi:hypothetical protein
MGSVQWRNEPDLCPDTLYEDGKSVAEKCLLVFGTIFVRQRAQELI